jgi:benzoylformate decarboxylase
VRERIVENLSAHDFIVAFGAPVFTYHAEGFGPYIPRDAELYQIIDDPQVASWTPVGTSIVGSLSQCHRACESEPAGATGAGDGKPEEAQ